jgi:hypothetical protein
MIEDNDLCTQILLCCSTPIDYASDILLSKLNQISP